MNLNPSSLLHVRMLWPANENRIFARFLETQRAVLWEHMLDWKRDIGCEIKEVSCWRCPARLLFHILGMTRLRRVVNVQQAVLPSFLVRS